MKVLPCCSAVSSFGKIVIVVRGVYQRLGMQPEPSFGKIVIVHQRIYQRLRMQPEPKRSTMNCRATYEHALGAQRFIRDTRCTYTALIVTVNASEIGQGGVCSERRDRPHSDARLCAEMRDRPEEHCSLQLHYTALFGTGTPQVDALTLDRAL